ncbi:hypothetical protein QCE63_20580 [Caballeronia sp. LZ065]|uniref:hypothetical protein n=1 Tax=Caballeronia sp. LZ065 TaxID=3038571 RepID=UPI0028590156|nr:hypothetical protein [Caballeronia sp. LZ065]MDR5781799.1 hypothetical protein [Caballeronia sp. LZ065]
MLHVTRLCYRCTSMGLAAEAKKKEVRERRLSTSHRLEQTMQELFPLWRVDLSPGVQPITSAFE